MAAIGGDSKVWSAIPWLGEAGLSRQLLALHRALTLDEFWRSLQTLFQCVLPSHSLSVYLNYFELGRGFRAFHAQYAPGVPRPWDERRRFSPTPSFLRSHVGCKVFELADLVPDRESLPASDYFRHVMDVEGWRSMLCLAYWSKQNPQVMVVLRRTGAQGAIVGAERGLVESLYDNIETALARIRNLHERLVERACLERCLPYYPLGLMILDPDLRPVLKNQEALEACRFWNYGLAAARSHDAAKCFLLPPPVREACIELQHRWSEGMGGGEAAPPAPITLQHSSNPRWSVSICPVRPENLSLTRPYFLVQLVNPTQTAPNSLELSADGLLRLQMLSPREQEVALAVVQGLSNIEIAGRFGKSETTVKSQLVSVFRKLDVRNRCQLAAALK